MSLLGLFPVKAIIFSIHIHYLYIAAIEKCFYKDRLANSRDGKLQLIKSLEKTHGGMINIAFLLEAFFSECFSPSSAFISLPHCGLLLVSSLWELVNSSLHARLNIT